jgi:single-stranded DNA-binding protein
MTEAGVSFAGNLTDNPEVRYTEGGIASAPSLRCFDTSTARLAQA